MKKVVTLVAGLAMAFAVAGCGGSPKSVAENFAEAVIEKDSAAAIKYCKTNDMSKDEIKNAKELLEKIGKEINDEKLKAVAYYEKITVPGDGAGYKLVNGAKITGENATVKVQFKKGSDLKSEGLSVDLIKIDGKWKINLDSLKPLSNLDTSDK